MKLILIKQVICKNCEMKCVLDIDKFEDTIEVYGYGCDKGKMYAEEEYDNNSEIFTTLVRIKGAKCNVVPVKSVLPIDKKMWVECSKALSRLYVGAPIKIGDVVCKNLLNTGVDIVCTKNVYKD